MNDVPSITVIISFLIPLISLLIGGWVILIVLRFAYRFITEKKDDEEPKVSSESSGAFKEFLKIMMIIVGVLILIAIGIFAGIFKE